MNLCFSWCSEHIPWTGGDSLLHDPQEEVSTKTDTHSEWGRLCCWGASLCAVFLASWSIVSTGISFCSQLIFLFQIHLFSGCFQVITGLFWQWGWETKKAWQPKTPRNVQYMIFGTRTKRIPSVLDQVVHFEFCFLFLGSLFFRLRLKLVWLLRPGWFIHENVQKFPGEYLQFDEYGKQETSISPQRFGKPMNRQGLKSKEISLSHSLIIPPGCEFTGCFTTSPNIFGGAQNYVQSWRQRCLTNRFDSLLTIYTFSLMMSWCPHCIFVFHLVLFTFWDVRFDIFRFDIFQPNWDVRLDTFQPKNILLSTTGNSFNKVAECGADSLFDLKLSNSATEFKAIYEQRYPNALVWDTGCFLQSFSFSSGIDVQLVDFWGTPWNHETEDLSQNPGVKVKRGRVNSSDGSIPTFTTSSSCLQLGWLIKKNTIETTCLKLGETLFGKLGACLQSQRWNRKLGRPMMGTEMMASMGLPVTAKLANECGVAQPDVSQLSQTAKAHL